MPSINNQSRLFFSASASPSNFGVTVYNALFEQKKFNGVYVARACRDAKGLSEALRVLKVSGCTLSMPLKSQIIPYLDELDEVALRTQSVNTVVSTDRGARLKGYNTDVEGAFMALPSLIEGPVLLYGTGSVAESIYAALKARGAVDVSVCARTPEHARAWASRHSLNAYSESQARERRWSWLINATPASRDLDSSHVLWDLAAKSERVFDLLLTAQESPLIARARKLGRVFIPGLEMAIHQLKSQFTLYTGLEVSVQEIRKVTRRFLELQA
jgi:shikimate dehydrogenase